MIFFLRAVKKRADMAMFAERRIGKPHRLVVLFAKFNVVFGRIHRGFLSLLKRFRSLKINFSFRQLIPKFAGHSPNAFEAEFMENTSRQLSELAVTKKI